MYNIGSRGGNVGVKKSYTWTEPSNYCKSLEHSLQINITTIMMINYNRNLNHRVFFEIDILIGFDWI